MCLETDNMLGRIQSRLYGDLFIISASVGDPWCLVQYWVATNEGTFDILGNFGVTPTVGTGGRRRSKKVATVEPKPALGRWCHLAHGQLTPLENASLRNLSKIGTTQTLLGNMSDIDICQKP